MESKRSVFETLNAINCNEHTEVKDTGRVKLTYLSWAWAWQMVKQNYPEANYTIYESSEGTPYFTDGRTCWVKTGVTIEGLEHIEYLPVMDNRNNSIPLEAITSMDMNKSIQRSLTKACARHGLGLYVYAGEDLPDEEAAPARKAAAKAKPAPAQPAYTPCDQEKYWNIVQGYVAGTLTKSGKDLRSFWIAWTHATPEAIAKFDQDVQLLKAAQSGKDNENRISSNK